MQQESEWKREFHMSLTLLIKKIDFSPFLI